VPPPLIRLRVNTALLVALVLSDNGAGSVPRHRQPIAIGTLTSAPGGGFPRERERDRHLLHLSRQLGRSSFR
jgi:hypothetical protein